MSERLSIFLAEDNAADAFLINEALTSADLDFCLTRATDGEAALEALNEAAAKHRTLNLIMLDLNLPKVSGHELLAHLRSNEQFRSTPVIIVTSSDSPLDRAKAADLKITHYFRKPTNFDDFLRLGGIVKRICRCGEIGLSSAASGFSS